MTKTGGHMYQMSSNVLKFGTKIGDSLPQNKVSKQNFYRQIFQFRNFHLSLNRNSCKLISLLDGFQQTITKEEQIRKLEEELNSLNVKTFSRTNESYGKGNNLEAYPMKHLNKKNDKDLMPCPRRPPKKNKE